ncbi:MAG: hypothetical protein IT184_09595 [Acidobacteria bacterium]|nr:hypothetical protein [Acidobacteriota bacterium]
MRVALLLPDGVGIRNFLLGPFRQESGDRLSLVVFDRVPDAFRHLYDAGDETEWLPYEAYRDTAALYLLRNTVSYAHMFSIQTWGMRCVRAIPVGGRGARRVAAEASRVLGRLVAGVGAVRWLDRKFAAVAARLPETARYREVLQRTRPDVLLSSNQRPTGVLPAVLAAQSLGIPTATCIFSWDNLTSKGRIAAPFDHYFVWSELMKRELRTFYPEVPAERIHIVGSPQFDPHAHAPLLSKAEFFARIGADPARPLICFSAGDPSCTPEDADHLEILLQSIRDGRIHGRPQVALRPTPTVDGRRFARVRERYPEVLYAQPAWTPVTEGDWSHVLPQPQDPVLLANLAHHSDLNVSVASTMTLDFAIHHRPVVNIAFDVASPPPFPYRLWDYYYQFEHYRPVIELQAALFARSKDELTAHVNTYLANPGLHAENRKRLLDLQLSVPPGQSSRRVVDTLIEIAGAGTTAARASNVPAMAAAAAS